MIPPFGDDLIDKKVEMEMFCDLAVVQHRRLSFLSELVVELFLGPFLTLVSDGFVEFE